MKFFITDFFSKCDQIRSFKVPGDIYYISNSDANIYILVCKTQPAVLFFKSKLVEFFSSPLKYVLHTLMEMKRTPPLVLIWKIKPQVMFYTPECKY